MTEPGIKHQTELGIEKHQIVDSSIRHAVSEIYLTAKHARSGDRLDDQEFQLIIAKLKQIESALIEKDSQ